MREATPVLRGEERGGATEGRRKDKEEKENGTVSKVKKQYPMKIDHAIPIIIKHKGETMI